MHGSTNIGRIIAAYDSFVIRSYVRIRFHILRQRFLHEIGQYLPQAGRILDIGCGFGLFSLFYAMLRPQASISGIDLDMHRIATAQRAMERLKLNNLSYNAGDAARLMLTQTYDAVYMLDIVHHIPPGAVDPLIAQIYGRLSPGGVMLIKDIDYYPHYKRWFTWWLDKAMSPRTPVHYWRSTELLPLIRKHDFTVYVHQIIDYLPYPHILYICKKPGNEVQV